MAFSTTRPAIELFFAYALDHGFYVVQKFIKITIIALRIAIIAKGKPTKINDHDKIIFIMIS